MKLIEVESSMIQAVGYDPESKELEVLFDSGKTYRYTGVPQEEYEGLLKAESKGRYMRGYIIDVYPDYLVRGKRRRRY
jgi:hypothetical protein